MGTATGRLIEAWQGNAHLLRFRLRYAGTRVMWDVAGAKSIKLEWNPNGESSQDPLVADVNHSEADWERGLVVVSIGPSDVTADVGSHEYSLTVHFEGADIVTAITGFIEVQDRPGD